MQDNKKKARHLVVRLLQYGIGFGLLLAFAVFFGAATLPGLFTTDKEVVAMAQRVIPLVALALVWSMGLPTLRHCHTFL